MGFLVALRFLTAIPLPERDVRPGEMGRSLAYFPAVGTLLGLILAGMDAVLRLVLPVSVASAVVVVVLVVLTGGLHLDGLMDSCDGLFGRRDSARRMEIMRDSRVGSFGALGAFCLLLMKYAALGALGGPWRIGGLILTPALGRWAMALAVWGFPYARADGLGTAFKASVGRGQIVAATVVVALVGVLTLQAAGIVAMVVAAAVTWLLAAFVRTRIPGLTGDTYGAIDEVVEVAGLLTFVALAGAGYG